MNTDFKVSFRLAAPYGEMLAEEAGRLGVSPSTYARARIVDLLTTRGAAAADDELSQSVLRLHVELDSLERQVNRMARDIPLYVQGILVVLGVSREEAAAWVAQNFGAES